MTRVYETAAIRFVPDFNLFGSTMRYELKQAIATANKEIQLKAKLDSAEFKAQLAAAAGNRRIILKAELKAKEAAAELAALSRDRTVHIKAELDIAEARARLIAFERAAAAARASAPGGGSGGAGARGALGGALGSGGANGGRLLGGIIDFGGRGLRPMQALVAAGLALTPVLVAVASSAVQASTTVAAIGPASLGAATAVGAVAGALVGPLTAIKAYAAFQKTGGAAAAKLYIAEMNKMSPVGRDFVITILKMKEGAGAFRRELETAVLPGFIKFLQDIAEKGESARSVIDIMKKSTLDMGGTISLTSARLGDFARSEFFKGKLTQIVTNNQTAFEHLNNAVVNLLSPLTNIFTSASPLLIKFTTYLENVTLRFSDWITELSNSGQLTKWFTDAGNEMAKWWAAAGNIFGIISNIFSVSLPTGQDLVSRLQDFTASIKEFTGVGGKWRDDLERIFAFFRDIDYAKLFKTVGQVILLFGTIGAFRFAAKHPIFALFAAFAAVDPNTISVLADALVDLLSFAAEHETITKELTLLFLAYKAMAIMKAFKFAKLPVVAKGLLPVLLAYLAIQRLKASAGAPGESTSDFLNPFKGPAPTVSNENKNFWNPFGGKFFNPDMPWLNKNQPKARTTSSAFVSGQAPAFMPGGSVYNSQVPGAAQIAAGKAATKAANIIAGGANNGAGTTIGGVTYKNVGGLDKAALKTAIADAKSNYQNSLATFRNAAETYKASVANLSDVISQGAKNIKLAIRNVADARRQGAESIASAERSLIDANREAVASQKDLTQARKDAAIHVKELKQDLIDLKNAEDAHRISLREAQLAQSTLLKNQADTRAQAKADLVAMQRQFNDSPTALATFGLATARAGVRAANGPEAALARDKAALAVREGQSALTADALKRAALKRELALGVEGSAVVVAAIARVAAANRNVADAQRTLSKAHRDAARAISDAQAALSEAYADNKKAVADATLARDKDKVAMDKAKTASDKLKRAWDALTETVKAIPPTKTTKVAVTGLKEAQAIIEKVFGTAKGGISYWLNKLGIVTTPIVVKPSAVANSGTTGSTAIRDNDKAAGGYINGPGTKTSDSIPLWGSKGEFMQPAHAVDYYGQGFMEKIRRHQLPKFAAGGPLNIDAGKLAKNALASKTFLAAVAAFKADQEAGGALSGAPAGSIVAFGRWIMSLKQGYRVGEGPPPFGPIHKVHATNSWHYRNGALDINRGAGTSALEQSYLKKLLGPAHGSGFRTIFMSPKYGHYDHLHVDIGKGPSLGLIGGASRNVLGATTGIGGTPSANERLGRQMAAARGWGGAQANALDRLWTRESGWRNTAQNPTSTAYGIAQFLNSTWAGVGAKKTSDPAKQIAAGLKYIAQRYGDPAGAWAHSQATGWYSGGGEIVADRGAMLPPHSSTMVHNNTGRSERVGFDGGVIELGPKTIALLVQALQSRPAELKVDGETIARHVNKELGHILTLPGVL